MNSRHRPDPRYQAVLWDFGGVILTSPFEGFARFEEERGLPDGFVRTVNAANHHLNAWARLKRGELSPAAFDAEFAAESTALGHDVRGADVLSLPPGWRRPASPTTSSPSTTALTSRR